MQTRLFFFFFLIVNVYGSNLLTFTEIFVFGSNSFSRGMGHFYHSIKIIINAWIICCFSKKTKKKQKPNIDLEAEKGASYKKQY